MDVLNAAHVKALVDKQTAIKWLAVESVNEMSTGGRGAEIDALVWVHQKNIEQRDVVAAAANRPRIRDRRIGHFLFGIENGNAAQRGIGLKCDERRSIGIASVSGCKKNTAVVRISSGCLGATLETDVCWNDQIPFDGVMTERHKNRFDISFRSLFQSVCEILGVVNLSVARCAEIADVQHSATDVNSRTFRAR